MFSFSIIYLLHTIWAFLKGVNYTYTSTQNFILELVVGIFINFLVGFSLKGLIKNNKLRATFYFVFIFVLVMTLRYRYRSDGSVDMAVIFDNFELVFNSNGASVLFSKFKSKDFVIAGVFSLIFSLIELRSKKVVRFHFFYPLSAIVSYLIIINYNVVYSDELSKIFSTSLNYFKKSEFKNEQFYKYIQSGPRKIKLSSNFKGKPDIYLILLESFNGQYINKLTDDGREITPVMNELYKRFPSINNYYSPTIQTIRAHYSILCSKIPRLRGKVSYALEKFQFNCLPNLIKKFGYQSFFYKSFQDMTFDNTQKFAETLGFDYVEPANLSKVDKSKRNEVIWGWGVQDNISYKLFLDRSIQLKRKRNKPIFSMMTTVSHHVEFKIPKRWNKLHILPENKKERFENSLHLSDLFLKGLLNEIEHRGLRKNSVFIITADHSFPNGEHGNFSNELGAYEENFKVPFVVISSNKYKPNIQADLTYSHYDILPTVLEIIGAKGSYESIGQSIFEKNKNIITPLIQPYDGGRYVFINYPFKRTWVRATKKYYETTLFNNKMEKPIAKNIDEYTKDAISFMLAELELVKKKVE